MSLYWTELNWTVAAVHSVFFIIFCSIIIFIIETIVRSRRVSISLVFTSVGLFLKDMHFTEVDVFVFFSFFFQVEKKNEQD